MSRRGLAGRLLTVGIGLLSASAAHAVELGLDGPEVFKIDWNARALIDHDVDGDGRTDLVLLNNDSTKIEILYQRPPGKAERAPKRKGSTRRWEPQLEDARFRRKNVPTGIKMFDVAVGDLDADGRQDLAFTGDPDGLTVLYQGAGGDWSRKRVFRDVEPTQWQSALHIADVDEDGRQDLILLAESDVLVFVQVDEGRLAQPQRYALSDEDCFGLRLEHVDGDTIPDLMYLASRSENSWRVRFGRPGGQYGPERAFRVATPRRHLEPIRLDGAEVFAAVHARTGLIEFLKLNATDRTPGDEGDLSLRVYSTPTEDNTAQSYALGDFDGNGKVDLVLGDRKGARVWLYLQDGSGTFGTPTPYPSLSDVRSVSAGDSDGDGRDELFVVSREEKLIGVSKLMPDGRMSYPEPVTSEGAPLSAAAVDVDGDGRAELAWLDRDGKKRSVAILGLDEGGGAWRELQRVELDDLRTDPMAIEGLDADQDGAFDLAVFTLQNPMRLLRQNEGGTFEEVSSGDGFRLGLVDDLLPVALAAGDVDGDGKPEMIVSADGFSRALRLSSGGTLHVVDQFNAAESDSVVNASLVVDTDGDGTPEVLLVRQDTSEIALLRRDRRGVYRQRSSIPVGSIELVDTRQIDLEADGRTDLLFLGTDRFWTAPADIVDFEVEVLESHETDLEHMTYVDLTAADLNGDGIDELVALDSRQSRTLQILTRDGDGGWESALHFGVFDSDPHYAGRQGSRSEPRQMLVSDLTSDGKPDIALLVHDRVLLYPAR